jgi:hypothetical protein
LKYFLKKRNILIPLNLQSDTFLWFLRDVNIMVFCHPIFHITSSMGCIALGQIMVWTGIRVRGFRPTLRPGSLWTLWIPKIMLEMEANSREAPNSNTSSNTREAAEASSADSARNSCKKSSAGNSVNNRAENRAGNSSVETTTLLENESESAGKSGGGSSARSKKMD